MPLDGTSSLDATEVSRLFDGLLDGTLTREAAERWAEERMRLDDAGALRFVPGTDERRLRDAVQYLLGVGLLGADGEYLHVAADFATYRCEAGL